MDGSTITVLSFETPVFREYDLNVTVRPGADLALKLNLGDKLRVENESGNLLGVAEIEGILVTYVETIPSSWLLCDHDPECRDLTGLIRGLKRQYGKCSITHPVSVILFTYTPNKSGDKNV